MKRLSTLVLIISTLGANYWLLQNFNTLTWPYLWPRPGIFILMVFFVIALWFRELFAGIWLLRVVGLLMIFIGQSYLIHTFQVTFEHFSLAALTHLIGFTGTFFVMTLNYINQIMPKNNKTAPPLPEELPYVAAVVPTYGEPYEILEKTVVHLKQLDYPADRLYILISDDGHRDEIRRLAELHQVHYNPGAKKDAKAGNLNSALEHLDQHFPQATLVLTQDADEIIAASFLKKTVGYFQDPKLAFVQTPKDAFAPKGDPFGNRDRVFYDILQPGRNGSGAAFSCGSGVIWRIAALKSIGGFVTWNLVEDMTTSYFLHSAGYRSEYHNEILTAGLSPDDIPGLLKQRGTWAADTWRFFLFNNPLRRPGLSLRQRLQYFELGMFYMASTLFMPTLMVTPILSVATGDFIPIEGSALFPWLAISFLYYIVLAQGNLTFLKRMWQYWVGNWPTYTTAFWIAVRSRHKKPSYKVTRKTRQSGFYGRLIWPQFLYLLVGLVVMAYGLFWLTDVRLSTRWANISILLFFMFMVSRICRSAFYGVSLGFLDNLQARGEALLRQPSPLLRAWQLAVYPIRFGLESTIFPLRPSSSIRRLVIPSMTISTLLFAGFIGVCGFVWQTTFSTVVAAPGSLSSPVYSAREILAQPPQDISVNVASETQTALPPSTPTIPPTATPSPLSPTATPTSLPFTHTPPPTPLASLTNTPTSVPTATPTFTPMSIPTESAILATPVVTTRPANSPTPIIMKYAAPALVEPQDQFAYIKGNTPVLRWEPVGNLAPNEQYAVRIVYRFQNEVVYKGAQVKESEWTIPLSLFGQVDGSAYLYEWFVVVERLNDDGSATAISPESGRHSFTWK